MGAEPSKSLVWRYIYQPIGWKISKIFLKTPITGNQISIFLLFLTIISFYLISIEYILTGMILLQVALLVDVFDGTVARLKKQTSLKGEYFEAIWHECIFPFFYFAMGIYSYKMFDNPLYIIMGSLTTAFIPIINLLFHRHSMIFGIKEEGRKTHTKIQYLVRWTTCPSHTFTYALILTFFSWIHFMVTFYFVFYLLLVLYKFKVFVFSSED